MGGLLPLFLLVAPLAIAIWDRTQTGKGQTAYTSRDSYPSRNFDRTIDSPAAI
jgi:hypothetical protein